MAGPHGDIRMMASLRKLKTMKKKFFVLREESKSGPARLEYHDSEKKFRNGSLPKRNIELEQCFNINKKSDTKHKYAIALYTKDDCFAFVCDSESDQEEWLKTALELQNCHSEDGQPPKPLFEHIWQVTIKPKGLANTKLIPPGIYRLCLTDKTLSLIRMNSDTADTQFQLPCIRRCGHTDCFFFMEVGRSSVTGPGELWMQVEDTIIAQNMHEAILSAMKSMNTAAEQQFMRPRSRSSCGSKPISVPRSRGSSPSRSSDVHPPKRSKTISEGQCGSPRRPRMTPGNSKMSTMGRPSSMHPAINTRGHSPALSSSPHSLCLSDSHAYRLRSDSLESRGSRGTSSSISIDEDMSPIEVLHSSIVSEEGGHFLSPGNKDSFGRSPEINRKPGPGYMEMSPGATAISPSGGKNSSYIAMSPAAHTDAVDMYADMGGGSFSTSPAVSTCSSMDTDDRGYLDMTPLGQSLPTVEEKSSAEGYMDMTVCNHSSSPSSVHLRPEKVYSYLSDDSGAATPEDFPKRAYSVGSKPVNNKNKPRNYSLCEPETHIGYLDTNVLKCNSAPHLPEGDTSAKLTPKTSSTSNMSGSLRRNSSQKSISEENSNFLMEMTFSRFRSDSESRGSQSSLGSCRSRTSSISSDMRPRTSSFGSEMRPRTSSINNNEMRPRSASQGHKTTRFFKRFSRDRDKSGSSDSLKRLAMGLSKKKLPEVASPKKNKKFENPTYMEIGGDDTKQDGYSYIDVTPEVNPYMEVSALSNHTLMPPFSIGPLSAVNVDKHAGSMSTGSNYMSMSPGSLKGHSPTPKLIISADETMPGSTVKSVPHSGGKSSSKSKRNSRKSSSLIAADEHGSSDYMLSDVAEMKSYTSPSAMSDYMDLGHRVVNPSVESTKMASVSSSSSLSSDYMNTGGSQSSSPSNFSAKLTDFSSDSDSLTRSSSAVSSRNTKKLKVVIDKKKSSSVNKEERARSTLRDNTVDSSAYVNVSRDNRGGSTDERRNHSNRLCSSSYESEQKTPVAVAGNDSYMIVSGVPLPPATHSQNLVQLDKIVSPIRSYDDVTPTSSWTPSGQQNPGDVSATMAAAVIKCASPASGRKISTGFQVLEENDYMNIPKGGATEHFASLSREAAAATSSQTSTSHATAATSSTPPSSTSSTGVELNRLTPVSGVYLPKRRSSPSLTTYTDQQAEATQDLVSVHKSNGCGRLFSSPASGLLIPGNRHSLQAPATYEEDAATTRVHPPPAFKRSLSQASPTSVEKELNYASLDLGSSSEVLGSSRTSLQQQDKVPRSPQSIKSRNSSGENYDDSSEGLTYAEIDFHKCKELRRSSSGLREGRFDFINQDD